MEFSVLMSVYYKENPSNLREALESITSRQTVLPTQIVIVKDGPLNSELNQVILEFCDRYENIFKIISLEKNVGLGEALRIGMEYCNYEYIARMDSDDISVEDRFEKQLNFIENNADVDLVGSYISEFVESPSNIVSVRKVPTKDHEVKKMIKTRSPVNHVTVFFKKDSVLSSGGYNGKEPVEDYDLWVRMILNKKKIENVPETLVFVRIGDGMYERRSNKIYIKSWINIQIKMLKKGYISVARLFLNAIYIYTFINLPIGVKKAVYKYFLRKSVKQSKASITT